MTKDIYSKEDIFIVTGSTSGIGKGVSMDLNNLGATVIAIGRNSGKLETLKKECKNSDNLKCETKDLSIIDGLDKWIYSLSKKYGKIKGLILCAGIQQILPISSPFSIEKSKELFEINYFSSMQIAKGFCDRRVNTNEGGSIVFISSIASIRGNSGIVGYSASKGALNAAVKSMAVEMARLKIRVNAILPGFVMTGMTKKWKGVYDEKYINQINNKYPLGIGKVSDVVGPILFLISDNAKWITGTCISVDGGGSL